MGATPIEARQMARRRRIQIGTRPEEVVYVYTTKLANGRSNVQSAVNRPMA